MALILVLLVICIALALSYAAVRSQFTGLQIQRNADRQISARQAAVTGVTMAIKSMHTAGWAGVQLEGGPDTTLRRSLGDGMSFEVTYTAGVPSDHPRRAEYLAPDKSGIIPFPYLVTLLSSGYVVAPDNPASVATYRIRAVVRLVPQKLEDEPTDWATMQKYTVYQTHVEPFEVDLPCQLKGSVLIQGKLKVACHYPGATGTTTENCPWRRYLSDLFLMHTEGGHPDYRPLSGRVYFSSAGASQDLLHVEGLDLLHVNHAPVDVDPVAVENPTGLLRYQIHPGGPEYEIPWLGTTLAISRGPDSRTNPLGIFYRDGDIDIQEGVTICGTLFCKGDIHIVGNVHFQPVELPALYGSVAPVRLPVATCRNFLVEPTASGDLTGLLAVFETFEIKESSETVQFAITGRVVAKRFYINERKEWVTPDGGFTWEQRLASFKLLRETFPGLTPKYFPEWMETTERDPRPLLTIKPDPPESPVTYHWKNWYNPVYPVYMLAPNDPNDPDDDGLHWELIEWTEDP